MITDDYDSPEAHEAMGFMVEERFEEALQILNRIIEREPSNAIVLTHIAGIKYAQDRFGESIELHKRAVMLAPDNDYVSITYFVALWGLEDVQTPFDEVKRFLSIHKSQAYVDDVMQHLVEAPRPPFGKKLIRAMESYMNEP